MSSFFEINSSSLGQLQIVKDLVFGWCIRSEGVASFKPLGDMDLAELDYLKAMSWPAYIPKEFNQAIKEVISEKRAALNSNKPINTEPTLEDIGTTKPPVVNPIFDSHRQISMDILTKAKSIDGVITADLGYAIYRGGYVNGQCAVESVSVEKGKITSFMNAEEAVRYIARKWW